MPLELDNVYNGYQTVSEWTFLAVDSQEEKPKPAPKPPVTAEQLSGVTPNKLIKTVTSGNLPQANEDSGRLYVYLGLLMIGIVVVTFNLKRQP